MIEERYRVNTATIARFFAPLAATSVLMMASHSLASSATVRQQDPTLALAAYSIAQSLGMVCEGPFVVARQVGMALVRDKQSWYRVTLLFRLMLLAMLGVQLLICFTPLGYFVFGTLLGAPEDVAREAVWVFRFFLIFPAQSSLRMLFHSIIILRKKTIFTTIAMLCRVSVMAIIAWFFIEHPVPMGGGIGAIVILSGVGTEAISSWLAGRGLVKDLDTLYPDETRAPLSLKEAFRFYAPLAIANLVANLSRMSIAAGLSRTSDPKVALAAFQVSWTISWIFINPISSMHQVTMVFARHLQSARKVRAFSVAAGFVAALLMLLFVAGGAGRYVLTRIIGVSQDLVVPALLVMALCIVVPIIVSWSEIFTGALLRSGDSAAVGAGRTWFVVMTTVAAIGSAVLFPDLGAGVAGVATIAGYGFECAYLLYRAKKSILPEYRGVLPFSSGG
jgi:progressive ankylosis protein